MPNTAETAGLQTATVTSWKLRTSASGIYQIWDVGPKSLGISISGTAAQLWNYVGVILMPKTAKSIPYSIMNLEKWWDAYSVPFFSKHTELFTWNSLELFDFFLCGTLPEYSLLVMLLHCCSWTGGLMLKQSVPAQYLYPTCLPSGSTIRLLKESFLSWMWTSVPESNLLFDCTLSIDEE